MLMCPDYRAVQVQLFKVRVLGQLVEDPVPHLLAGPAAESHVHAVPVPESPGQVTPRNPGAQNVQHTFYEEAVVGSRSSRILWLSREHLGDSLPLIIPQHVPSTHTDAFDRTRVCAFRVEGKSSSASRALDVCQQALVYRWQNIQAEISCSRE